MRSKLLIFAAIAFLVTAYSQLFSQGISDPVGDASPPSVDYVETFFEQQGESLYIAITMDGVVTDRMQGYSTSTFFCDTDADPSTGQPGSRVGSDCNLTFTDIGNGVWFMREWVLWNPDPAYNSFAHRNLSPVTISEDGKTMSYKMSLVGTGWEEIEYDLNGWYKDGTSWHQVPHFPGDMIEEAGILSIDVDLVTQMTTKEGTLCTIEVPEPYSATADAKNITGVVDEMMSLVRAEIGTIADAERKYLISYEMFGDYTKPYPYSTSLPNQLTTRIPGQYWIDEPDWLGMLDGLVNMTLMEISAGAREVLLTQNSYHMPIPGANEGWYCTQGDSVQGFLWDAFHKYSFKALLGRAFENCLTFCIAEGMTDGEAKTAIMAKKADAEAEWNDFSGDAFDLTPEILTGFLIAQSSDLAWTKEVYTGILPDTLNTDDLENSFSQLVNAYIQNDAYSISSSSDFEEQLHHGWYASIASVQAAVLSQAMDVDIFAALQNIPEFPLDQEVYDGATALLTGIEEESYEYDDTIAYEWTEINSIGTALTREQFSASWGSPDTDDGSAGPIDMGISFTFYGQSFDSIYVGVNGQCSFTDPIDWITTSGYGTTIPGMGWDNIICPLACDIMAAEAYPNAPYHTATGTIYYYHDADANQFIIEYEKMTNHHYVVDQACTDTTITFQVVLDADDNSITYYYKDLGIAPEPVAKRATIGIQPSKDGTLGVQYYGGEIPEDGYPTNESAIRFSLIPTAVEPKGSTTTHPAEFALHQNYPNPFNPKTTFAFSIPELANVTIKVYNMLGKEVASLVSDQITPGYHTISWDASDLASGIYFYKLDAGQYTSVRKCLLLK